MYQIGLKLEEILVECSFGGEACETDDFTLHIDPWYYNCYTLNSSCVMHRLLRQVRDAIHTESKQSP